MKPDTNTPFPSVITVGTRGFAVIVEADRCRVVRSTYAGVTELHDVPFRDITTGNPEEMAIMAATVQAWRLHQTEEQAQEALNLVEAVTR